MVIILKIIRIIKIIDQIFNVICHALNILLNIHSEKNKNYPKLKKLSLVL